MLFYEERKDVGFIAKEGDGFVLFHGKGSRISFVSEKERNGGEHLYISYQFLRVKYTKDTSLIEVMGKCREGR